MPTKFARRPSETGKGAPGGATSVLPKDFVPNNDKRTSMTNAPGEGPT